MKLDYDVEVDILCFGLEREDAELEDTLEFADGVFVDVDEDGNALGIEFISQDAFSGFVEEHGLSLEILSWIHGGSLHKTLDVASRNSPKF